MNQKRAMARSWRGALTVAAVLAVFVCAGVFAWTTIEAQKRGVSALPVTKAGIGSPKEYHPTQRNITVNPPVNFAEIALKDKKMPRVGPPLPADDDWQDAKPDIKSRIPIVLPADNGSKKPGAVNAPSPSATGPSPGPTRTYKGEFLSGTSIPPDTAGAVGTTHTVTPSNNMMSVQTRDGVGVSRITMNAFWAGATVKGVAVASAFDTKVYFDRFNSRFILVSSLNGPGINSGMGVAVTQTADPTGTWNRFTAVSDPASTAASGHAIDYPSVGFNKNWIVVDENTFNFNAGGFTSYYGQQIFVFDKAAAYNNTLVSSSLFEGTLTTCLASATPETELGCGFTMAPAITEDNTTLTDYMAEDWDSTAAQLRLSKITGTPAVPVLTVGTQFPQSTNSWRFNAARIGTTASCGGAACSGGYMPQRQQSANLTSGTRIMANDSRIQNTVFRNGTLWATHTVMVAATPTLAGTCVGGSGAGGNQCATNAVIDNHTAVQWWAIDPTIETGLAAPPIQRARIEDPTADNCHDGNGGTRVAGTCISTGTQVGQFYAFPNISVNMNNDVLIGFSQFSNLTYPSGGYAIRRSADPINTTRDPVIFRPGQANYNIGAGSGSQRQNRWGDYSSSQTDPVDDTKFWTVQEYSGAQRDFGIGIAGPWETWYAQVDPAATAPSLAGNLIISEFRLRGPQGVNDEYVELYNPGASPVIVNTTDNSDGWALAYSTTAGAISGVAVIPNGTVVKPGGHFLIARNQDPAVGPTLAYSLNSYAGATNPATLLRGADSDTGFAIDNADNGGFAIFKTSTVANFSAGTRMDSVGFSGVPAGLFKEGAGIPAMTTQPTTNWSYLRTLASGTPQDTGANETDFTFVDVTGAATPSAGVNRLGAPGPENLDSPVAFATLPIQLIDSTVSAANPPNQVADPTVVPNGANGTVSLRRTLVNTTGVPLVRLRFRISSLATLPGASDFRLLTSSLLPSVTTSDPAVCGAAPTPCNVAVQGLTLEEPPTQALGGGINASVAAGTITFAAPLAISARVNVNFVFGVQGAAPFAGPLAPQAALPFGVIVEAIQRASPLAPSAANVSVAGRVLDQAGYGVARATVTLAKPNGDIVTAITNAFGYFSFDGIEAGNSYFMSARAKRLHFDSQLIQVSDSVDNMTFVAN